MSEVKRFGVRACWLDSPPVEDWDEVPVVLARDYDALLEQARRLRKMLEDINRLDVLASHEVTNMLTETEWMEATDE